MQLCFLTLSAASVLVTANPLTALVGTSLKMPGQPCTRMGFPLGPTATCISLMAGVRASKSGSCSGAACTAAVEFKGSDGRGDTAKFTVERAHRSSCRAGVHLGEILELQRCHQSLAGAGLYSARDQLVDVDTLQICTAAMTTAAAVQLHFAVQRLTSLRAKRIVLMTAHMWDPVIRR